MAIRQRKASENKIDPPPIETVQFWDGWCVEMRWEIIRGRPEPAEISFVGYPVERPITGRAVRNIPIGTLIEESQKDLYAHFSANRRIAADIDAGDGEQLLWPYPDMTPESKQKAIAGARVFLENEASRLKPYLSRRGPQRGNAITDETLAEVAQIYKDAWKAKRGVTEAVATAFTISTSAAGKRIQMARAKGYLDGIGKGTR